MNVDKKSSRALFILLFFGIIIFCGVTLPSVDEPFIHHHDFNSAYWSLVARNYAEHGIMKTHLAMIVNTGPLLDGTKKLLEIQHPPLYPLMLSLGFKLFGDKERATRSVQWSLSLLLLLIMWIALKDFIGSWAALFTVLISGFTPVSLYFSTVCNFDQLTLIFVFASLWAYLRWFRAPQRGRFLFLSLSFFLLASQVDWQGYEFAVICLHAVAFRSEIGLRGGKWRLALLYLPVGALSFLLYLAFVKVSTGDLGALVHRFLRRSGSGFYGAFSFDLLFMYLHRIYGHLISMYTHEYLALAAVSFAFLLIARFKNIDNRENLSLSLILALFGLIHYVSFPVATFAHDYLVVYFMPAFTFTLAAFIKGLFHITWSKRNKIYVSVLLMLFLTFFAHQSRATVLKLRKSIELDVREVAQALSELAPHDALVYTNMKYEGHQLGYYSRREIVYADKIAEVDYPEHYYLEFRNTNCTHKFRNRIAEEVISLDVPSAPKSLIFEGPCFSLYSLDL